VLARTKGAKHGVEVENYKRKPASARGPVHYDGDLA